MRGTIDKRYENATGEGKKYVRVEIGGQSYSIWDSKYFQVAQEGTEVEFQFKEQTQGDRVFRNITAIRGAGGAPMAQLQAQGAGAPTTANKDIQIARQSSLKTAVEFLGGVPGETEATVDEVIQTAEKFVCYVMHGLRAENVAPPEPNAGLPEEPPQEFGGPPADGSEPWGGE